jgi:hypothetical protein
LTWELGQQRRRSSESSGTKEGFTWIQKERISSINSWWQVWRYKDTKEKAVGADNMIILEWTLGDGNKRDLMLEMKVYQELAGRLSWTRNGI